MASQEKWVKAGSLGTSRPNSVRGPDVAVTQWKDIILPRWPDGQDQEIREEDKEEESSWEEMSIWIFINPANECIWIYILFSRHLVHINKHLPFCAMDPITCPLVFERERSEL